jgi:SAM-dependent methyltransferase
VAPSDTTTEIYDALAPIYDAMGGAQPFAFRVAERLERLFALRRAQFLDSVSFLDLGCGTGTLLLALRALHPAWRLCGVDVSPGMLAAAVGKPAHEGVLWTRARLPGPLPFGEQFDVVGSFYDTLNHLPDLEALAATFRTVAAVLRPGGLFVFDLNSAFGFEQWWQYRIAFDLDGHHIDTQLAYDALTRTGRAEMDLARGDGQGRRFVLQQRCFSESEVERALVDAGLTLEVAAPWSPVAKDSPSKTWVVATKKH